MPSEETLALANHYLGRFTIPEDKFGLGPFLENGSRNLYARSLVDGSMLLDISSSGYWECRTIALELHAAIKAEHPELNPRIMFFSDRGRHNWVEITCPKTGEKIQIDGTPWYAKLNPGHVGSENDTKRFNVAPIPVSGGIPFSVRKVEGGTISVYLMGFLPKVSLERTIQKAIAAMNGKVTKEDPDYRFILAVVLEPEFGKAQEFVHFYFNVKDSRLLQSMIRGAKSIDELIAAGALEIGRTFSDGTNFNIDIPYPSLEFMRIMADKSDVGKRVLFAEVERNLHRIMKLLALAMPSLRVRGTTMEINVATGKEEQYVRRPNLSNSFVLGRDELTRMLLRKLEKNPIIPDIRSMQKTPFKIKFG